MKKISLYFIPFCLWVMACSSMSLNIASEPSKADVYLKDGKKLKKLGVTPLILEEGDLGSQDQYNIAIKKEGFQTQELLIEKRSLSSDTEVFASLQKLTNQNIAGSGQGHSFGEKDQRSLASIQTQLMQNNYSQAEVLAKNFLNNNPYSAVGWNLLGNAYLLQNQNSQALKAYSRALQYDPENQDTIKMVEHLQGGPVRRDR